MKIKTRHIVHADDIKDVQNSALKDILREIEKIRVDSSVVNTDENGKPMISATIEKGYRMTLHTVGSFEDTLTLATESLMLLLAERAEASDLEEIDAMYSQIVQKLTDNCDAIINRRERVNARQEIEGNEMFPTEVLRDGDYLFDSKTAVENLSGTPSGANAVRMFGMIDTAQKAAMDIIHEELEIVPTPDKESQKRDSAEQLIDALYYENGSPRIVQVGDEMSEEELREKLTPGMIVTARITLRVSYGEIDVTIKGRFTGFDDNDDPVISVTEQLDSLDEIQMPANQVFAISMDEIIATERN